MVTRFFYLLLALLFINPSFADNNATKDTYFYNGQSLNAVLTNYAKNNNLQINFTSQLRNLTQPINGKFSLNANENILDILARQYGFNWFSYSGTLYITSNKSINKTLEVAPDEINGIKNTLDSMGLLNPKFGFSAIRSDNKIILSGPKEYVDLLINQIKNLNIAPSNEQFAVYRLKYAKVTDTSLNFNNQNIVIPGVATILQRLISGRTGELNARLSNNIGLTNNQSESSTSVGILSHPIIEADSRLNTIVIRDKIVNLKRHC